MTDSFGRNINYLRVSLTDRCNLRCRYCMPEKGIDKKSHRDILSLEDIYEIIRIAVEMGFSKVRLTGGEPLVRKGVIELCRSISGLSGVKDFSMTTNGLLLPEMARELKAAGLMRLNISLDTLDPDKYHQITRIGSLDDALAGIAAAEEAGFTNIKLNTVLIGGFNDCEIPRLVELTKQKSYQVRFIELMPIGHTYPFDREAYLPMRTVLERVPELEPVQSDDGVARLYRLPGAKGTVGLISPLSDHFCSGCNRLRLTAGTGGLIEPMSCAFCADCTRIRITADGKLKPCLHSAEEIPLRGLHGDALKERIEFAVSRKPERHCALSYSDRSGSARDMNRIGG